MKWNIRCQSLQRGSLLPVCALQLTLLALGCTLTSESETLIRKTI